MKIENWILLGIAWFVMSKNQSGISDRSFKKWKLRNAGYVNKGTSPVIKDKITDEAYSPAGNY